MFKGWSIKDLAYYYNSNVDEDCFYTFIDWIKYLKKTNQF